MIILPVLYHKTNKSYLLFKTNACTTISYCFTYYWSSIYICTSSKWHLFEIIKTITIVCGYFIIDLENKMENDAKLSVHGLFLVFWMKYINFWIMFQNPCCIIKTHANERIKFAFWIFVSFITLLADLVARGVQLEQMLEAIFRYTQNF